MQNNPLKDNFYTNPNGYHNQTSVLKALELARMRNNELNKGRMAGEGLKPLKTPPRCPRPRR